LPPGGDTPNRMWNVPGAATGQH